jgi:hypothetical protein
VTVQNQQQISTLHHDLISFGILQAHAQQLAAIAEDTAVLHISAAALDKDEGG